MTKWADYLISAVQYNQAETHINKVKEHKDDGGDTIGSANMTARTTVVSRLKDGKTYKTITKNSEDKWVQGATVQVIKIDGAEYIKTVADDIKKDNLGSLPRF